MFTVKRKKPGRKVSNKENFDNCNRENQEFIVKVNKMRSEIM